MYCLLNMFHFYLHVYTVFVISPLTDFVNGAKGLLGLAPDLSET